MKRIFMLVATAAILSACGDSKTDAKTGTDEKAKETPAEPAAVKITGKEGAAKLPGKWQLDSVSGENLTESEKTATIEYRTDGTFTQGRGDKQRTGEWLYEGEGSNFINMTADGKSEPLRLVSCDDNVFKAIVVKNNMITTDTLTMKRIK